MMTKTIPSGKQNNLAQHKREMLHAIIGEQVIHGLGEPSDLLKVQVKPLWDDHYRVNVLAGADAASVRIAASYFVVANSEGTLTACTPKIVRQFSPPA
jgi:hypothetical protein